MDGKVFTQNGAFDAKKVYPHAEAIAGALYEELQRQAELKAMPPEVAIISTFNLMVRHLTATGFPREYLMEMMDLNIAKVGPDRAFKYYAPKEAGNVGS